jgi:hypothetical protein
LRTSSPDMGGEQQVGRLNVPVFIEQDSFSQSCFFFLALGGIRPSTNIRSSASFLYRGWMDLDG